MNLFFIRRAKRIFPALAATLFICFWFGACTYPSGKFKQLSGSVASAIAGLSNIYFWREAGYFDIGADLKPALHTWSLAVEAQFYLIYPFIVGYVDRGKSRGRLLAAILALGAASLILSLIFGSETSDIPAFFGAQIAEAFKNHREAVFYLMPFHSLSVLALPHPIFVWTNRFSDGDRTGAV